jgi:hypothetical protein
VPLEHVAREEDRAGDHAVALALQLGADIDENRARLGEQIVGCRAADCRN